MEGAVHAIEVEGEGLVWREVAPAPCGPGEVRVEIAATAINRADLIQRTGGYPPPPGASSIMGLECAGVVAETGEGVTRVSVGDEVCALLSGGGYASETIVPAGQVLGIPKGLSLAEAAAIPEVFATAYLNLYMEAGIRVGERALIHAGASGVGTAASQMLKASGNPCFVTASGDEKIARCLTLGAQAGHDRGKGGFLDAVQAWTGQEGVDVVLDPVGGQYLADNLASLRLNGRLILIGLMSGAVSEINLGLLMMKRLTVVGSTLRARPIAEKAAVMDALKRDVWPNFENGSVKPIIEEIIPIEKAEDAHALVASNQTVGKVVMSVN